MAGYSGTPLVKKLSIREDARLAWLGKGPEPDALLGGLSPGVQLSRSLRGTFDVIVLFVRSQSELAKGFASAQKCLDPSGGLWVAWPKKSSGVASDMTDERAREVALAAGLVDNKVCAIDETWSGLRCVVRVADRPKATAKPARVKASSRPQKPSIEPLKPGSAQNHLGRVRSICLAFPEATEVVAWGHPTFRVRDKIFASTGFDGTTLGVKATPEQQADLVSSDPRFQVADYVGRYGWVTMSLSGNVDFGFVESLIAESYRLVAPKTLTKAASVKAGPAPVTKKATAKRAPVASPKASKRATTTARPRAKR